MVIVTRGKCRNNEATSISQLGKEETVYLANEMSRLFGKDMQANFYTSMSNSDKLNSIIFARGLYSKKRAMDYSICTVENELSKESISAMEWLSEFRYGDCYVDVTKIRKLLREFEAKKVKLAYIFLSRDRAQQWVDELTGEHTERMPESSAVVIDTLNPKSVRFYGKQLELKIAQRDQVREEIENSMYKTIGLIRRNL